MGTRTVVLQSIVWFFLVSPSSWILFACVRGHFQGRRESSCSPIYFAVKISSGWKTNGKYEDIINGNESPDVVMGVR